MKEPYIWDYTIRIKTKEGSFEYEEDNVLDAVKLAEQFPDYEEFYMQKKILKCDKCNIQLSEVFIQQGQFRKLRLCKTCNDRYLQYMENVKKLEKLNKLFKARKSPIDARNGHK